MKNTPKQLQIDSTHIKVHPTALPLLGELTAGNMSDYTVCAQKMADYPLFKLLLADKGSDSNKLREALKSKNIKPCIPGRKQ